MRLYSYVNMYMEGIHAGIQTAHVMGEIHNKYSTFVTDAFETLKEEDHHKIFESSNYKKLQVYAEWQKKHKVIQVYNGGYSSSLRQRYEDLHIYSRHFQLPIAQFHEGKDALDGALTAVAIVVPEKLYGQHNREADPESNEGAFYRLLHNCKHAR